MAMKITDMQRRGKTSAAFLDEIPFIHWQAKAK